MKTALTFAAKMRFYGVRAAVRAMVVGALGTSLAACAHMPPVSGASAQAQSVPSSTAASAAMSQQLLRQVSSIAQLTDDIRATNGTTWSPHYNGFSARTPDTTPHGSTAQSMVPEHVSGPLGQAVYVQWSGSARVFLQALAQKMGYTFDNRLGDVPSPDVAIDANGGNILSVLRTVAIQLPNDMTVKVDPGRLVLMQTGGRNG